MSGKLKIKGNAMKVRALIPQEAYTDPLQALKLEPILKKAQGTKAKL
jgi:hypothetical protein